MASANRRVSAASARAHTRKGKSSGQSLLTAGLLKKLLLVSFVGLIAWAYKAIQPPPPAICGSANGPPVTAPRIRLRDGRFLAYHETGVPKEKANYKIVFAHSFMSLRLELLKVSKELIDELGVYMVTFDRPGYGESDPDPNRSPKSAALDVQDLADALELGPKFYVISYSLGGHVVWGCLKYIPNRLAGAALIAPVINYRWPSFPANLSRAIYNQQPIQDQWALRIPYYAPWLTHWWMTQKWFPSSTVIQGKWPANKMDKELQAKMIARGDFLKRKELATQQGVFESLHRDMMVMFGKWEFDPMELENPFPNGDASVHVWQGDEDALVPASLQRYIASKLHWIRYHELPGAGHLINAVDGIPDRILKSLLVGDESSES